MSILHQIFLHKAILFGDHWPSCKCPSKIFCQHSAILLGSSKYSVLFSLTTLFAWDVNFVGEGKTSILKKT